MIPRNERPEYAHGICRGPGAEWAFAPNWSVKGEYLWTDLGSKTTYTVINIFPEAVFADEYKHRPAWLELSLPIVHCTRLFLGLSGHADSDIAGGDSYALGRVAKSFAHVGYQWRTSFRNARSDASMSAA